MVTRSQAVSAWDSSQDSERWHLARKTLLLFLLVVAAALGLVILFRQGRNVPQVLFNLMADVGLGVLMGAATRIVLRRRHGLIKALVSGALSIVGLAILGALTAAKSGIGPIDLQLTRLHWLDSLHLGLWLPLQLGRGRMDVLDLAHVVIATSTAWVALRAWRGQSISAVSRPMAVPRAHEPTSPPAPRATVVAHVSHVAVPAARQGTVSRPRPVIRQRRLGRPMVSTGAAVVRPARGSLRRKNPFRRRPAVQLAAYEEHRCPYCLEDVKRGDARGAVECPICHTLHHKDCWDITGTCQVPHLNG